MAKLCAKVLVGLLALFFLSIQSLFSQSIPDIKEKIDQALQDNNQEKAIELYYDLGGVYWKQEELGKSIEFFEKGTTLSEDIDNSQLAQYGWYSKGLIALKRQDFNEATKSFKESYNYADKVGDTKAMCKSKLNLGKSYAGRNRIKRAIREVEDALQLAIKRGDNDLKQEAYLLLSNFYTSAGESIKAEEAYNNYTLLMKDSKHNQDIDEMEEQISSVKQALKSQSHALEIAEDSLKEVKEISEKRQLQIDLLNTEKALTEVTLKAKDAELRNNRLVRNSLIVGFLLLGVLAVVIYKGYKDKMKANQEIHKKQVDIESSINYGLRIQQAMLPTKEKISSLLPQSFIFFKPRDVVSGDFYWVSELYNEKIAVAAVDCTGHGVPGAFMSMIGSNALDSIANTYVDEPDKILHELHQKVLTSLKQEETGNKDGMDMALCVIDTDRDKLYFSGAKNHLIYIKEGEVFQIRGDRHPIGGIGKVKASFTQHAVDLEGEMSFYLYSDGFVDQFGGPENMKFMSKRFKQLILEAYKLPMEEQRQKFEDAFNSWKGNGKQTDDILVMGFRVEV